MKVPTGGTLPSIPTVKLPPFAARGSAPGELMIVNVAFPWGCARRPPSMLLIVSGSPVPFPSFHDVSQLGSGSCAPRDVKPRNY